jgi:hypothetical protein
LPTEIPGHPSTPELPLLELDEEAKAATVEQPVHYCTKCHALFSEEEYARDHAEHDEGLPKPSG